MERYGAPYAGGWMRWPLKWLKPVETAMNVYHALTAVNAANARLEGDALAKWNTDNARTVKAALAVIRLRDEMES